MQYLLTQEELDALKNREGKASLRAEFSEIMRRNFSQLRMREVSSYYNEPMVTAKDIRKVVDQIEKEFSELPAS